MLGLTHFVVVNLIEDIFFEIQFMAGFASIIKRAVQRGIIFLADDISTAFDGDVLIAVISS